MSQLIESSRKLNECGVKVITAQLLGLLDAGIRDIFDKPNKQISQLIAKKWLEGTELTEDDVSEMLKQGGHGDLFNIIIDRQPYTKWHSQNVCPEDQPPKANYEGYWTIPERRDEPIGLYIPFPERPSEKDVTSEYLQDWVNQDPGVEPFYPENVWIPYTC